MHAAIVLDELLFICSHITHLELACALVNPTGAFSWKNLNSLSLSTMDLNNHMVQNILSGSPLLETFKLNEYYGFSEFNFTSKSVKKFVISGEWTLDDKPVARSNCS